MVKSRYERCRELRGCLPTGMSLGDDGLSAITIPKDDGTMRDWYTETVPTDAQVLPSCVGRAVAQMLMILRRRKEGRKAITKATLIDGDKIWKRAREMFYGGDMDGGLLLHEGVAAAENLGYLAKGSYRIFRPRNDLAEIDRYLSISPLLQGTGTWPAWDFPEKENGQIARGRPDWNAGHATLIVDVQKRDGRYFNVFANSWGTSWGRHGYGILNETLFQMSALDRPLGIAL
jgi:hypothetical protein